MHTIDDDDVSDPFFARASTNRHIANFARSTKLAIYAGSGVSIDRTGLSWRGLSELLLAESSPDFDVSSEVLSTLGQQRIASVAVERLTSIHGERTSDRIASVLRNALYRDADWVSGNLIDFMSNLMIIRKALGYETQIITTNYDDYIEEAFLPEEFNLIVNGKRREETYSDALGTLNYLHGRIPENGNHSPIVVSEADYASTQVRVCEEIYDAATKCDLLILGSSLTDPPLVRSLVDSRATAKAAQLRRLVVFPRQGNAVLDDAHGRSLAADGARHLGCDALFPDFFGQVAQFVHEIAVCSTDPTSYSLDVGGSRYMQRLDDWWRGWLGAAQYDQESLQRAHHSALRMGVDDIREILDGTDEEALKLEAWIRWSPDDRRLQLWASSVGAWPDLSSAHSARISPDSKYASVRAFCIGHPYLYHPEDRGNRWRTYLALPVRIWKRGVGSHVVGTITLASMNGSSNGSVSLRNRANLRRALTIMDVLGRAILDPAQSSLPETDDA